MQKCNMITAFTDRAFKTAGLGDPKSTPPEEQRLDEGFQLVIRRKIQRFRNKRTRRGVPVLFPHERYKDISLELNEDEALAFHLLLGCAYHFLENSRQFRDIDIPIVIWLCDQAEVLAMRASKHELAQSFHKLAEQLEFDLPQRIRILLWEQRLYNRQVEPDWKQVFKEHVKAQSKKKAL